uniref:Fes1 domain-containing protein n=1 Tax=Mesocestoides corti TaxID=53468 RepID=A0A5K3FQP3_MESCO
MCTVPNNLKGLLRFCMEAGSEFSSEMEPMDPQRAKWLREALESMTVDLASEMRKRIVTIIQNISSSDFDGVMEDTASALDDLIDFTEDMNLADIFLKIGGLELLKALFNLPTNVFSAQTGMLLSNIVQNHEEAQKVAINEGFLEISMQLLLKERDPTNMSGLLSGISSLVRSCAFSQKHFIQKKGFESLFVVLETTCQPNEQNKYERFNEKTSFFIFCLCQELFDEQLG